MKSQDIKLLPDFIVREIEGDYILWFSATNHYIQVKEPVWDVVQLLEQHNEVELAVCDFASQYNIDTAESRRFVNEILANLKSLKNGIPTESDSTNEVPVTRVLVPFSVKNYKIGGQAFSISYAHPYYETIIHPLFAHHLSDDTAIYHFEIDVQDNLL